MTAAPQPQPPQTPPTAPAPSRVSRAYGHTLAILAITWLLGEIKKTYLGSAAPAAPVTAMATTAVPLPAAPAAMPPVTVAKAPESASTTMPPGQYFDYNGRPVR